jgi:D-serine deaminase-like pyridoxal phosphate-dependent protein
MGNFFAPTAGRFGVLPNLVTGRCAANIANSTTTTYNFGGHPATCLVSRAMVSAGTVPTSASAVTGVLQKYDATANAAVALTAAVDLLTLTAHEGTAVSLLSSLTDAQKTLRPGDTLRFVITAAGTITAQAVDLMVNTEVLVQN